MPRPPELFLALRSDRVFYWLVGLFTVLIFLVGLATLAATKPGGVGSRELLGFVVGFSLFMSFYFLSMTVYRLVPE